MTQSSDGKTLHVTVNGFTVNPSEFPDCNAKGDSYWENNKNAILELRNLEIFIFIQKDLKMDLMEYYSSIEESIWENLI